jgi:hypothetical protein
VRRLRDEEVLLVADAKWKVFERATPADDDLKQMFAYNELFAARDALLIYPRTDGNRAIMTGEFVGRGHRCAALPLGLFGDKGLDTPGLVEEIRRLIAGFAEKRTAAEGLPPSMSVLT